MTRFGARARVDQSGLSLLELLVAMGLLASLGGFIVQLLRSSFDLYSAGEKRGEFGVNSNVILTMLADDLANVVHGPDGRFLLERRKLAESAWGNEPFLRFVRTVPNGDLAHRFLRLAGTKSKPELDWWGEEPSPESRDALKPASGLMEVCYAILQEGRDDQGVLTLYRGVHTPVLEPGGFFMGAEGEPVVYDAAWVRLNLEPVATGILGFDILCAGPGTRDWERASRDRRPDSAFDVWDSTRGVLETFPLAVGPASATDVRDDIYPRRARITLTLTRPGRPDARLGRRLAPTEESISVDAPDRLPREGDAEQDVNVSGEWMTIVKRDMGSFRVARSPRKGAATLAAGTPVYVGRTFAQTVDLPSPRPTYDGVAR